MAKSTDIPLRYASAWLDAADESGVLTQIRREIDGLQGLLAASAEFAAFLEDRLLPPRTKQALLTSIFQGKVEEITFNFLLLLAARQRERLLSDILLACHTLLDQRDGIMNAEVTGAMALTATQSAALRMKLETYTGKRIRMNVSVNPGLLGGFVVRVGDTVFDCSLQVQLRRVRQALVGH